MKELKWIIYFDKDNINHCGSDWSTPSVYSEKYIIHKIRKGDIYRPKDAVFYVIASDYQFMHNDTDYLWNNLPLHIL